MLKGKLGSDAEELKKCASHKYGLRFKSYKKGYLSGKIDSKHHTSTREHERAENPYTLTPDVIELLRKRARWEMGYEMGWAVNHRRRLEKNPPQQAPKKKKRTK